MAAAASTHSPASAGAHLVGRALALLALLALMSGAGAAVAASPTQLDGDACRTVRLSDVGWTDVTATTALFSVLLERLGYRPQVTVLAVPVTFASMKNKDIAVFLRNWTPAPEGDSRAYV